MAEDASLVRGPGLMTGVGQRGQGTGAGAAAPASMLELSLL